MIQPGDLLRSKSDERSETRCYYSAEQSYHRCVPNVTYCHMLGGTRKSVNCSVIFAMLSHLQRTAIESLSYSQLYSLRSQANSLPKPRFSLRIASDLAIILHPAAISRARTDPAIALFCRGVSASACLRRARACRGRNPPPPRRRPSAPQRRRSRSIGRRSWSLPPRWVPTPAA